MDIQQQISSLKEKVAASQRRKQLLLSLRTDFASKDAQLVSNKEEINRLELLLEQSQQAAERDKENVAEAVAAENAKHAKEIARLKLQLQQEAAADELKSQLHQQLEEPKTKILPRKMQRLLD